MIHFRKTQLIFFIYLIEKTNYNTKINTKILTLFCVWFFNEVIHLYFSSHMSIYRYLSGLYNIMNKLNTLKKILTVQYFHINVTLYVM